MNRSEKLAALFTALGILFSVVGRFVASWLQLPLWLDSVGAMFVGYALGPVPGAAVGLSSNIIFALFSRGPIWYGITNLVVGVIVGLMARQGYFKSLFGTLTVGSAAAVASTLISTPLNFLLNEGYPANMWGDGVFDLLVRVGVPSWLSAGIGEFYLDFVDKILTALLLYGVLRGVHMLRGMRQKRAKGDDKHAEDDRGEKSDERDQGTRAPHEVDAAKVATALVFLAVLAGALFPGRAMAKPQGVDFYSYVQEVYGYGNGLPCGESNDIAQTTDGILWIGTYAGLYRYNGREFQLMSDFDSVKNVNCLYVDEEGRLWIGTNDMGLSLCVKEHISNVFDTSSGLPSDSVRSIIRSSDGTYYVGTSDVMQTLELSGGINMLDQIPEVVYATSLSADKNNHVAAVTASGDLFVLQEGKVKMQARLDQASGAGTYTCCLFDDYGRLFVGTSEGKAFLYDISQGSFKELNTYVFEGLGELNSLYITEDNNLFGCTDTGIGTFVAGLEYMTIHTGQFNNSIDHMMTDYQGNYWFTSSRLGVLKMTRSTFSDVYEMAGLDREVVNTTVLWQGLLYVGTDEGLDAVDLDKGKAVTNELTTKFSSLRIRCNFVDSRNHLWLCTYGEGIVDVAPDGTMKTYNAAEGGFTNRVRACEELQDGTIIASGDTGVALIKDDKIQSVLPYGPELSSSQVLCFLPMDDGLVLSGTDGDGILAMRDGKVVWRSTVNEGLSSNIVMRIVPARSGDAYFVVTSNGLCVMDGTGSARVIEKFPYFNNFDVQMGENGDVFVLSSAGIYVAKEQELLDDSATMTTDILDARSGLGAAITANSWNCKNDKDLLYISTDQGVFSLDMRDYADAKRSYHMKVSSIEVDGVPHDIDRGDTFEVDQNATRVDISAEVISYTLDDPYVEYQLVGYDAAGMRVRKSELGTINYTNIPAGEYVFKLSVLAGDDTVLEEARYPIRKAPMIYDNSWFMAYVFVVAVLILTWLTWYIARFNVQRRLENQQRELELARQQIEMADQTVLSIAHAVDAKDVNTSEHSHRVSEYSVLLARELGFSEDECENLRKAALLHDIGKIGIPDKILNKPGRLTDEEYAIMKTHVSRGAEILKDFTMIDHVVEGALYHHERYDGRGYVTGLSGEKIPLYGRIIAVADAFDAMTQNRVYREKQDLGYVLGELERGKGTQFDPEIATIMLRLIDEGKIDHILNSTNTENEDEEAHE